MAPRTCLTIARTRQPFVLCAGPVSYSTPLVHASRHVRLLMTRSVPIAHLLPTHRVKKVYSSKWRAKAQMIWKGRRREKELHTKDLERGQQTAKGF